MLSAYAQNSSWQAALGQSRELAHELREEIVSIPQLHGKVGNMLPALVGTLYQPPGIGPFAVLIRRLRLHPDVIEHLPDIGAVRDEGDRAHLAAAHGAQ